MRRPAGLVADILRLAAGLVFGLTFPRWRAAVNLRRAVASRRQAIEYEQALAFERREAANLRSLLSDATRKAEQLDGELDVMKDQLRLMHANLEKWIAMQEREAAIYVAQKATADVKASLRNGDDDRP